MLPMRVQTEPPRLAIATDSCGPWLACLHEACGRLAGSMEAEDPMDMRSAAARERMPSARAQLRRHQRRAHVLPMRVQTEPPRLAIATDGFGAWPACLHGLCGALVGSMEAEDPMNMRSAAAREQ